jgi:hypothetical protein
MHRNATGRTRPISIEHANAVAHAAVLSGRARWDARRDGAFTPSPRLSALLDDLGITTLAAMNVRQARAVLAFIVEGSASTAA